MALLYGPGVVLDCSIGDPRIPYNAGGGIGDVEQTAWLPGAVAVDVRASGAGSAGRPGWDVVAGRVAGPVARVTVEFGSATATVPAVNGTYLVRFLHGVGAPLPDRRPRPDRPGVRRRRPAGRRDRRHLVGGLLRHPGRPKISGNRTDADQPCQPAVRWR